MSGFTPGPWKTDGEVASMEINGRLVPVYEVMAESDACWVAQVLDHHRCGATAPGAVNARLIAAAPAMYELWREWIEMVERAEPASNDQILAHEARVRTVLTEIEGKSNV